MYVWNDGWKLYSWGNWETGMARNSMPRSGSRWEWTIIGGAVVLSGDQGNPATQFVHGGEQIHDIPQSGHYRMQIRMKWLGNRYKRQTVTKRVWVPVHGEFGGDYEYCSA